MIRATWEDKQERTGEVPVIRKFCMGWGKEMKLETGPKR